MFKKICFASVDVEKEVEGMDRILGIFKKYNISATLFVTGEVLKSHGNLAKEWSKDYEIACHSFTHRFWDKLGEEERKKELEDFINLYQEVFGSRPAGFRAPSHIIDAGGIKILEEYGFSYDSSIVPHYPPFKKYRGYKGKASLNPHHPKGRMILEIPVRGQVFGFPLAAAWFSKLPPWLYKTLFYFYSPSFMTLNMHSWDVQKPSFLSKLDKLLDLLKKKNYQFLNGEEIYKNYR